MNVALYARIKTPRPDGTFYFPKVRVETETPTGKKKPTVEEPNNATTFYLRFTENGKRIEQPVKLFTDAVAMLRAKQEDRFLAKHGIERPAPAPVEGRESIAEKVAVWISELKTLDKAPATIYAYSQAVNQFQSVCFAAGKKFMDQIDREAVLAFINWMRENVKKRAGDPNGTIRARLQFLSVFLLAHGIQNPLPKKDWPKVAQKEVLAFTVEEINQLLSKATSDETDLIQFFLFSGFRDDEVAHVFFTDIDWKRGTLNISPKPEYGFRIKNRQKRPVDIQLPADFLARMKARRLKSAKPDHLIFPSNTGRPDSTLLTRIRKAAKRAKYTAHFGLHRFRKTFGTLYGERFGIANAQALLGHADIRTTQKYLARTVIAKSAVETLFAGVGK